MVRIWKQSHVIVICDRFDHHHLHLLREGCGKFRTCAVFEKQSPPPPSPLRDRAAGNGVLPAMKQSPPPPTAIVPLR